MLVAGWLGGRQRFVVLGAPPSLPPSIHSSPRLECSGSCKRYVPRSRSLCRSSRSVLFPSPLLVPESLAFSAESQLWSFLSCVSCNRISFLSFLNLLFSLLLSFPPGLVPWRSCLDRRVSFLFVVGF